MEYNLILDGTRHIPKYGYIAFWINKGTWWELNYRKIHKAGRKSFIIYKCKRYYLKDLNKKYY